MGDMSGAMMNPNAAAQMMMNMNPNNVCKV